MRSLLIALCICFSSQLSAQVSSQRIFKATILSAVLPGSGQIYNQKIWKAPIVWAGLGACTYFFIQNNNDYQIARESYVSFVDNIAGNEIAYRGSTNVAQIQSIKNNFRNNRDLSLVIGIVLYTLNIVDAHVDAHFFNFPIKKDLSLRFLPSHMNLSTPMSMPILALQVNHPKPSKPLDL
jgi:hypothetical protein